MQIYYYYKYKCKDGKKKRGLKGLKSFLFQVSGFRLEGFEGFEGCSEAEVVQGASKEFRLWALEIGIWALELCLGIWNLDLGTWNLVFWNLTTPS